MTWVRRQAPEQHEHTCQPPTRELVVRVPSGSLSPDASADAGLSLGQVPGGQLGDLWRCDACRKLWRISTELPAPWSLSRRRVWRPATWWQRLTHPDRGTRPSRGGGYPAPEVSSDRLPRVPPGPGPGSGPRPPRPVPPPPFEPVWRGGSRLAPGASPRPPRPDRPTMPPPNAGTALDPAGAASVPPPTITVPAPPPPSSDRST